MNLSSSRKWVTCHVCNKNKRIGINTYLAGEEVKCLDCQVTLGYIWDIYLLTKEEYYQKIEDRTLFDWIASLEKEVGYEVRQVTFR